jgi:hypothetical protein
MAVYNEIDSKGRLRDMLSVRKLVMGTTLIIAAGLNAHLWAGLIPPKAVAGEAQANQAGCTTALPGDGPLVDELEASLNSGPEPRREVRLASANPNCNECVFINYYEQFWCILRPPGTDCSGPFPWWNNFEYSRWVGVFDCGEAGLRIFCHGWTDSGCCNNSFSEPSCQGWGATESCLMTPGGS